MKDDDKNGLFGRNATGGSTIQSDCELILNDWEKYYTWLDWSLITSPN